MRGKYEFETYFAAPSAIEVYMPCSITGNPARRTDICLVQGGYYPSFHRRLLLLAADVELNPGPTTDTECILKAIEASNEKTANEIRGLKVDIAGLKGDISGVQKELKSINTKVQDMENRQTLIETEVQSIKSKLDSIEHGAEMLHADVGDLSVNDERRSEQIDDVFSQLNAIDRELRKCNLRIFGVPDDENETKEETKTKVMASVLNAASGNSDISDVPDIPDAPNADSCMFLLSV